MNAIGRIWEESMLHTKAVNECLCVCINGGNESKERGRRKFNPHEEKTSCIYQRRGHLQGIINVYMHEPHPNRSL